MSAPQSIREGFVDGNTWSEAFFDTFLIGLLTLGMLLVLPFCAPFFLLGFAARKIQRWLKSDGPDRENFFQRETIKYLETEFARERELNNAHAKTYDETLRAKDAEISRLKDIMWEWINKEGPPHQRECPQDFTCECGLVKKIQQALTGEK